MQTERLPVIENNKEHSVTCQRLRITKNKVAGLTEWVNATSSDLRDYIHALELNISDNAKMEIGKEARKKILDDLDYALIQITEMKQSLI